jgi:integrase
MSTTGGSVRKRPNGTWEGRYREDGRQKSVYAKTEREAQELLRKAMTRVDSGVRVKVHKHTVATYLKQWLDTSVTQRCRPSTLASYQDTVDRYIVPAIGSISLSRLKADDVRAMLARLAKMPSLSSTTQRYAYTVLRIALGRAM